MRDEKINEMIEIIASIICEIYRPNCDEYVPHDCGNCFANSTAIRDLAETLYNEGYRKQSEGEWTKHIDEWDCEYAKCSCCGEEFYDSSGEDTIDMFYKFCPNCGAKMKGGAE